MAPRPGEAAGQGDVRVVRHARNLGMARPCAADTPRPLRVHRPPSADRQVARKRCWPSCPGLHRDYRGQHYVTPPSGEQRRLMSLAFRFVVRGLGGLRVNFAGTYVFHRRWLDTIDLASVRSETFLFSFELLERLRRAGSRFAPVTIRSFVREVDRAARWPCDGSGACWARSCAIACAASDTGDDLLLYDYAATVGEGQRGLNLEIRLVSVAFRVKNASS